MRVVGTKPTGRVRGKEVRSGKAGEGWLRGAVVRRGVCVRVVGTKPTGRVRGKEVRSGKAGEGWLRGVVARCGVFVCVVTSVPMNRTLGGGRWFCRRKARRECEVARSGSDVARCNYLTPHLSH